MIDSPLAVVIAQIVVLVLNAVLYARQKNAVDVERRDRGVFGPRVDYAVLTAEAAKREAENIDGEKYRALASIVQQQAVEIADLKAKIRSLEESVQSMSNKLASRERADRSAERRAAQVSPPAPLEAPPDQQATAPGGVDAATLAALGAIPLRADAAPAAAPRGSFGRKAA